MAYDANNDRIVLFGGRVPPDDESVGDTWAYDYDADTWIQMSPPDSPSVRSHHTMSYYPKGHCVVLFGGVPKTGHQYGDTWTYDYSADSWTELDPPESPSDRGMSAMVYDAESERVILFEMRIFRAATSRVQRLLCRPAAAVCLNGRGNLL